MHSNENYTCKYVTLQYHNIDHRYLPRLQCHSGYFFKNNFHQSYILYIIDESYNTRKCFKTAMNLRKQLQS